MAEDYYKLLGVSRDASQSDIKKAYRKLAVKYHPDKNPDDTSMERKFKEINAAYDILKDEQKRAAYDRYGENAFNGMGGGAGAGGFDFGGSGSAFSDIFEDLFGGGGGRGRQSNEVHNRGSDLRYNLSISLEDAFFGNKKEINVTTAAPCSACDASGSADKGGTSECSACHGAGRVRVQQGFFMVERTCSVCSGTGVVIKNPCRKCRGDGRVKKAKKLSVSIPKGVEEGTRIRLNGEGEAGLRGGEAGDLYVFVTIEKHELFVRDGSNIHCTVPISFTTSALGGSVEIPTIDGSKARITIPEGTQTGDQFRLRSKGMNLMNRANMRGDMYVHTVIETPVKLSKRQKELLREFDELSDNKTSPVSENFFNKVKEFLS